METHTDNAKTQPSGTLQTDTDLIRKYAQHIKTKCTGMIVLPFAMLYNATEL